MLNPKGLISIQFFCFRVLLLFFAAANQKYKKKGGRKKTLAQHQEKWSPFFCGRSRSILSNNKPNKQQPKKCRKKHLKTSMSVVEDLFTTINLTRQRCVCVCIFAIATKCSGIIAFRRRRRLDILYHHHLRGYIRWWWWDKVRQHRG